MGYAPPVQYKSHSIELYPPKPSRRTLNLPWRSTAILHTRPTLPCSLPQPVLSDLSSKLHASESDKGDDLSGQERENIEYLQVLPVVQMPHANNRVMIEGILHHHPCLRTRHHNDALDGHDQAKATKGRVNSGRPAGRRRWGEARNCRVM